MMLTASICVNIPQVKHGKKDDVVGFIYFAMFFARALTSLWFFSRYYYREEQLSKTTWDGSTLGMERSQLMCYMYETSFRRLLKFFRLRLAWDLIIYVLPAIIGFIAGVLTISLLTFITSSVLITHLLCATFLMHSWCMKGRYRLRSLQWRVDKYVSQSTKPVLEEVVIVPENYGQGPVPERPPRT